MLAPDKVRLCRELGPAKGLSTKEMGGVVFLCSAGGGSVKAPSMSRSMFPSAAIRSVDAEVVGGGFGRGIAVGTGHERRQEVSVCFYGCNGGLEWMGAHICTRWHGEMKHVCSLASRECRHARASRETGCRVCPHSRIMIGSYIGSKSYDEDAACA